MDHLNTTGTDSHETQPRTPYITPTLTDLGSVAEITQGSSGGSGTDSGIYS